jgi:hypothetical protein
VAERPIFIPTNSGDLLVQEEMVSFKWDAGMAISQAQKRILKLHEASLEQYNLQNLLEISSKSLDPIGVELSAFNLSLNHKGQFSTVESMYQGSKVFKHGGPFTELLCEKSIVAKKDPRIRESGPLIGFELKSESWSLEPTYAFYDWLYLNALLDNPRLADELSKYEAFTDIEFNPKKSFSCQARTAALYSSLSRRGKLEEVLDSKESYLDFLSSHRHGMPSQASFFFDE